MSAAWACPPVRAQAGKASGPVEVSTDGVGRYLPEIETAIYFCCMEALQNAARHAPGSTVRIGMADSGAEVTFTIADDGPGFDPAAAPAGSGLRNVSDRLAALDGTCQALPGGRRPRLGSQPGSGGRTTTAAPTPMAAPSAVSPRTGRTRTS